MCTNKYKNILFKDDILKQNANQNRESLVCAMNKVQ